MVLALASRSGLQARQSGEATKHRPAATIIAFMDHPVGPGGPTYFGCGFSAVMRILCIAATSASSVAAPEGNLFSFSRYATMSR